MSRWNKKTLRVWFSCTISGLTLSTLSGSLGSLLADQPANTQGAFSPLPSTTETYITRDGRKVVRRILPQTPRRQYNDDVVGPARTTQTREDKTNGTIANWRENLLENSDAEASPKETGVIERAVADQLTRPRIVQIQAEEEIVPTGSEADELSPVQRKLRELYERDRLEAPPLTLDGVNKRNRRRSAQRPRPTSPESLETPKRVEEKKPSFLSRFNPFSKSSDEKEKVEQEDLGGDFNDLDADEVTAAPETESRTQKLVNRYRKQTPRTRDVSNRESSKPNAKTASKTEKSFSKTDTTLDQSERLPTRQDRDGELPTIVPRTDPTALIDDNIEKLPEVVPGSDEFDIKLPLPSAPEAPTTKSPAPIDGLDDLSPELLNDESTSAAQRTTNSLELSADPIIEATKPVEAPKPLAELTEEPRLAETESTVEGELDPRMQLIAARGAVPGLKGFCPVTLKLDRELVDAKAEFNSIYQGVVYGFASAEAKNQFDRHPQYFAPVNQGLDVVLKQSEISAPGSLDNAIWYQDQLFLFSSPETLKEFTKSPDQFCK